MSDQVSQMNERTVFNPDLGEISTLMADVWKKPCWKYSEDVLTSYIHRPTGDAQLSLGIYIGDQPAGYVCYVPYQMYVHGTRLPILYATWWTASPRYAGRSIALKLQKCLIEKTRSMDYAGILTVTHHGSYADKANRVTFSRLHESFQLKSTFPQMMATPRRILRRMGSIEGFRPALYESGDGPFVRDLLKVLQQKLDVCQDISSEDLDYVLQDRPLTRTWVWRTEGASAFLNVTRKHYLAENRTTNAYVEKACLDRLNEQQRMHFFAGVFSDSFWKDIDVVCVPDSGMIDRRILQALGFAASREQFNLYCIPFDNRLNEIEIHSFCLDVF